MPSDVPTVCGRIKRILKSKQQAYVLSSPKSTRRDQLVNLESVQRIPFKNNRVFKVHNPIWRAVVSNK